MQFLRQQLLVMPLNGLLDTDVVVNETQGKVPRWVNNINTENFIDVTWRRGNSCLVADRIFHKSLFILHKVVFLKGRYCD